MKEFLLAEQWYIVLIMTIVSYLLGGLSGAVFVSKEFKHEDIREKGSGNPGTMNMARTYGFKFGLFTFIFDALKGSIPTLLGFFLYKDYTMGEVNAGDVIGYLNGFCVVLGHVYPVLKKFKGGKGIATTFGVFSVGLVYRSLWFILIIPAFYFLLLVWLYFMEYGSVVSLVGITSFAITQLIIFLVEYGVVVSPAFYLLCACVVIICALDWYAHRENIKRLLAGEEHKTSLKKMLKKKK